MLIRRCAKRAPQDAERGKSQTNAYRVMLYSIEERTACAPCSAFRYMSRLLLLALGSYLQGFWGPLLEKRLGYPDLSSAPSRLIGPD